MPEYQRKEALEADLMAAFGNKLQPICDKLENRHNYARLAKLTEDNFYVRGGHHNADRFMRSKLGRK